MLLLLLLLQLHHCRRRMVVGHDDKMSKIDDAGLALCGVVQAAQGCKKYNGNGQAEKVGVSRKKPKEALLCDVRRAMRCRGAGQDQLQDPWSSSDGQWAPSAWTGLSPRFSSRAGSPNNPSGQKERRQRTRCRGD